MAFETAERLLRHNRHNLVRGDRVVPQWIDGGARFWYSGFLVDPMAGTKEPCEQFPGHTPGNPLEVRSPDGELTISPRPVQSADGQSEGSGEESGEGRGAGHGERRGGGSGEGRAPGSSEDRAEGSGYGRAERSGDWQGYDLWVGDRALTSGGDFGASPDYFMHSPLLRKLGLPHAPPAVLWSPDSSRILTHRTVQDGVRETHLVESLPAGGGAPRLVTHRYSYPGDERCPLAEFVVIDVASGAMVEARTEPVRMPVMSPIFLKWAWWAEDGSAVYFLSWPEDVRTLVLHRLDPVTGEVTTLVSESGQTRVEPAQQPTQRPMVRVLPDGRVLWYSQRDGWGHLYLYADGVLRAQVTRGDFAVQEILRVDGETVYFVASGLVEEDVYRRSVCRVGLDGAGFARITDDNLDHVVTCPENGGYFIDSASTTDLPSVTTVKSWDGHVLVDLEKADISDLVAAGWTAPERFRVKAADGHTDIYGVLYRPHDFDPGNRYPVLDHVYPGPQSIRVTPSFDPGFFGYDAEAVAALGFVVVAVDGRGTPGRDKAFHDASYRHLADAGGLADHVAALDQLAATRPWMDLDRVGVFGHSAGGFATVRAMLEYPGVFKAGVAESGAHDYRFYIQGWGEAYDGPYDEEVYAHSSNVELADRLEGKLLLIHGGMDENASPHLTLRLAERLVAADKDFDLLIIPGADHMYVGYELYVARRRWNYLLRHLMPEWPPPAR